MSALVDAAAECEALACLDCGNCMPTRQDRADELRKVARRLIAATLLDPHMRAENRVLCLDTASALRDEAIELESAP